MWGFNAIENQSTQHLEFCYDVATVNTAGSQLNATRGNATLEFGASGSIVFTDVGHTYSQNYWGVEVKISNEATPVQWLYVGAGALDVLFKANGDFELTSSAPAQTIKGHFPVPAVVAH